MIEEVLSYYRKLGLDPGYQGYFEQKYCGAFSEFQGGGFADAVATGTAALFVALAALDLPHGSEVLVSPITDPGTLSAVILNGLKPRLMDSLPDSFNIGPSQFEAAITAQCRAAVIVHAAGRAVEMPGIMEVAGRHGIRVLEDCSQAHGAAWDNRAVGTFGDIAAFSTMYRKAHITGASGGVVYTRNQDLYHAALAHADRGKPSWRDDFDDRNPNQYLFPALNLHSDEISCAIGIQSLARLPETISKRRAFVRQVAGLIENRSQICRPYGYRAGDSPFIHPIFVNRDAISCSVTEFALALREEGIGLNPHYEYLVVNWPFLKPYLAADTDTPNARNVLDGCFALYLNENYGEQEAQDIADAIAKVEACYAA